MIDSQHAIVDGVPHVYQFQKNRSQYRCVAFVLAALSYFAYPSKWHDLNELAHQIYEKYAGQDVESNTQGMSREQALNWLEENHIGYIDLHSYIEKGELDTLRQIMAAMNRNKIPHLLTIADESHLRLATNNEKLHSWNDTGLSHCIVRLGMQEEHPVGYYLDPAAPCPPFPFPTPVLWDNILAARPITAIGIMPPGVHVPPADFNWLAPGVKWPAPPPPPVNHDAILSTVEALRADNQKHRQALEDAQKALETQIQAIDADESAFLSVLHELGLK